MPEIVPVQLTLPSGQWFTLYQSDWDDADDESLGFLGSDDQVFAFPSAAELAAYVGSERAVEGHHLADSPLWAEVRHRTTRALEPVDADRHDLTDPSGSSMLTELVFFLRVEPDDPLQGALAAVDRRVGPPDERPDVAGREPVEAVAPGTAALWLGLAGTGAYLLVRRDDDGGEEFLGADGELCAATTSDGLAAFLAEGSDPALASPAWEPLRGRADLDCEPYEDDVVDLDELTDLLSPDLDRDGADQLLAAWGLLRSLATWLGADDVLAALDEDTPLGRFLVRDALDIASGSGHAASRLAGQDLSPVVAGWTDALAALAQRLVWVDPGTP